MHSNSNRSAPGRSAPTCPDCGAVATRADDGGYDGRHQPGCPVAVDRRRAIRAALEALGDDPTAIVARAVSFAEAAELDAAGRPLTGNQRRDARVLIWRTGATALEHSIVHRGRELASYGVSYDLADIEVDR